MYLKGVGMFPGALLYAIIMVSLAWGSSSQPARPNTASCLHGCISAYCIEVHSSLKPYATKQ